MKDKTYELKKQLAHCPVNETDEVVLYEVATIPKRSDDDIVEYVTWFKDSKGSLYWGNYFLNKRDATKDFANRILDEAKREDK